MHTFGLPCSCEFEIRCKCGPRFCVNVEIEWCGPNSPRKQAGTRHFRFLLFSRALDQAKTWQKSLPSSNVLSTATCLRLFLCRLLLMVFVWMKNRWCRCGFEAQIPTWLGTRSLEVLVLYWLYRYSTAHIKWWTGARYRRNKSTFNQMVSVFRNNKLNVSRIQWE